MTHTYHHGNADPLRLALFRQARILILFFILSSGEKKHKEEREELWERASWGDNVNVTFVQIVTQGTNSLGPETYPRRGEEKEVLPQLALPLWCWHKIGSSRRCLGGPQSQLSKIKKCGQAFIMPDQWGSNRAIGDPATDL